MNILLYIERNTDQWRDALARGLPDARIYTSSVAPSCDYAVVWKPPAKLFVDQSGLRAIFALGAGVDAVLTDPAIPRDVPLIRIEDSGMARQMIEYALYTALHQFRAFDDYGEMQSRKQWRPLPNNDRSRFHIAVLGLGALGGQVAQALAAFGFAVHGWSRHEKTVTSVQCHHGDAALNDVLATSQTVMVMLPLTQETRGMLDRKRLEQLPHGACLVNLARGAIVNETDLLELLDTGHIQRAFLDVFTIEPLPTTHRFWSHPCVTVTPHVAALTPPDQAIQQVVDKIKRLERGETVSGLVDRRRGY